MNGKELIKRKQNIFTKIKLFFRNIFVKKHKDVMLNAGNTDSNQKSSINNKQKEQFFNLYNDIKNGNVNVFNVDIDKLEKICQMLEEECNLKEKKLKNTRDNIETHKKNIACYKNIA